MNAGWLSKIRLRTLYGRSTFESNKTLVKKCPKKFAYKINVIWESCQSHARMDLGTEIATGTACMLLTTYNTDEHLFQNPPKAKLTTLPSFLSR